MTTEQKLAAILARRWHKGTTISDMAAHLLHSGVVLPTVCVGEQAYIIKSRDGKRRVAGSMVSEIHVVQRDGRNELLALLRGHGQGIVGERVFGKYEEAVKAMEGMRNG